jgi:S1-C subfamily serine protease
LAISEKTLVTVECVSGFEGFGQSREIPRKVQGMVVSATGLVMVPRNMESMESGRGQMALSRPEKIQIVLPDKSRMNGEYIGSDPDLNVAFFEIADPPGEVAYLELADEKLELSSPVISVRLLPEEYDPRLEVAWARVSVAITKPRTLYRTHPSLGTFNGFPAFNPEGKVVGWIRPENQGSGSEEALSMLAGAVAIEPVGRYLDLINSPPTKSEKGWLGIRMEPLREDLAELWGIEGGGIIVIGLVEGAPAGESGLQAEDVIVAMDGRPLRVNSYADLDWFRQEVRTKRPGDSIEMDIVRGAPKLGQEPIETKDLTVTLGLAPPSQIEAAKLALPEIGLKLRALTLDFLFSNRLAETMGGVVADYVERAGPSDIGQVNENDVVLSVNGREVLDLAAAEEVFADLRNEKPAEVILHVLRGQTRLFLKVTPDWE